jgi:hypothetical protein
MSLITRQGKGSKLTIEEMDGNLEYLESANKPIDITYLELYNKVVNGELLAGSWYRLTDYKSVNFLNGWEIANNNPTPTDPNFDPQEIYEGETEVLILQAKTPYEIAEIGYSETFNGDVIQYVPYTNKIGIDLGVYNGNTLPNSSEVSGFDLQWDGTNVYFNMPTGYPALFGHYFYLYCEFDGGNYYQDGCFEPLTPGISTCQYSYTSDDPDNNYLKAMSRIRVENNGMKIVLLDLTEEDYDNYDADSLYVETIYALGDAYGWITRRQDTHTNIDVPFDFRSRKYRRFEVDLSSINSNLGTGYWGQGDDFRDQGTTGNYKDLFSINWKETDSYNIEWKSPGGPDRLWYNGFNDNVVFLGNVSKVELEDGFYNNTLNANFKDSTISNLFNNNTINNDFAGSTIRNNFNNNLIGSRFRGNTTGNGFSGNTIGSDFQYNTLGNTFQNNTIGDAFEYNAVGTRFSNNTIGNNFVYNNILQEYTSNTVGNAFARNKIGSSFFGNTIGIDFQSNTFGETFANNIIGNTFQYNIVKFVISLTNFTSATHVYASYNCEIFRRSNNTLQLSYINGTNVIEYAAINA